MIVLVYFIFRVTHTKLDSNCSSRHHNSEDNDTRNRNHSGDDSHSLSQRELTGRSSSRKRDDLPRAYSSKRSKRGGRLGNLKQVTTSRTDPRLLINRRNRLLRLRLNFFL